MIANPYRAGFVHILGKPNAGKSTLFNALVKYPLSIVSYKPQTTRQSIKGIYEDTHCQIVYMDTPGYLEPAYALQRSMMRAVYNATTASDLLLWVVDVQDTAIDPFLQSQSSRQTGPWLLLLNKIDTLGADVSLASIMSTWCKTVQATDVIPISALDRSSVDQLTRQIVSHLPVHPPYYDQETLTDRSERFFAADLLRKALFLHYHKEIPYSVEVLIEKFQEQPTLICISAVIYVERASQKGIIIGHKGQALKKAGIRARKEMEAFFQKRILLTQHVKVMSRWRHRKKILTQWGYC